MRKIVLLMAIVLLVMAVAVYYMVGFPGSACDAAAPVFRTLYAVESGNLEDSFSQAMKDNVEILKNCSVNRYQEFSSDGGMKEIAEKYSVKSYNVSFSCSGIDFSTVLYVRGKRVYYMTMAMVPCGGENVLFVDTKFNYTTFGGWYYTKSAFEQDVIEKNLVNLDFCVALRKQEMSADDLSIEECRRIASYHLGY